MKVIAVRFKNNGKSYFFDPGDIQIEKDDYVIVETVKGIEYAQAVSNIQDIDDARITIPLRKVMRKATDTDKKQVEDNVQKEKNAYKVAQEKILEHKLDMKLTDVEYAFDNSKIIFFFVAEQRVDFRDLVKDLAGIFRTRIELRQIGVRDEARSLGGFGSCGRPLCCAEFLSDFVPVSIKMAKEQNLSLNPTKISGVCGRLMCCLKYEEEAYEELNSTMPAIGDYVATNDGFRGDVAGINVLRQIAKVLVENGDEKELRDYAASEVTVLRRKKGKKNGSHMEIAAEDSPEMRALLEDEAREREAGNNNGNPDQSKQGGEGKNNRQPKENRGNGGDKEKRGDHKNRGNDQARKENKNPGQGNQDNRGNSNAEGGGKGGNPENGEHKNNHGRRDRNRRHGRNRDDKNPATGESENKQGGSDQS